VPPQTMIRTVVAGLGQGGAPKTRAGLALEIRALIRTVLHVVAVSPGLVVQVVVEEVPGIAGRVLMTVTRSRVRALCPMLRGLFDRHPSVFPRAPPPPMSPSLLDLHVYGAD
jgi:hypothetical protein